MGSRISVAWWPALLAAAPVALPILAWRNRAFVRDKRRAAEENAARITAAQPLDLPPVEELEITVLADWRARDGFRGEAGVSCLFRTPAGSLLFDVGFGDESGVVAHNAARLGVARDNIAAVAISHLHNDHMGGTRAFRSGSVSVPAALRPSHAVPCYLPAPALAPGFEAHVVQGPQRLAAGIASTGPLARRLFFLGWVEEQALVVRLRGRGLVVFTGCGHQTLPTLLAMVRKMSGEPIYALGGGLHLPLSEGRLKLWGLDLQTILGTGKMPWKRICAQDVEAVVDAIRDAKPKRLLLSAHDTCDVALRRLSEAADCDVQVLDAGAVYKL